jgi:hypothetical protein
LDVKSLKGRDFTLRGCVQEGAKKDHYVLTRFSQVPASGEAALPRVLNDGRPVFFWMEDLPRLDKYFHQMVEVRGKYIGTRGETDPKITADNQQILEVHGPGRNVKVTPDEARAVGTSGTLPTKTLLIRVDVDDVNPVAGACD